MSSPDDFTPHFDDLNNDVPVEDETYAPPPPKAKKSSAKKKGKKAKKYVAPFPAPEEDEEEEHIPFARPITSPAAPPPLPEPSEFQGVDLHEDDFPADPAALNESPQPHPPSPVPPQDEYPFEDDVVPMLEPLQAASPTFQPSYPTLPKPRTVSLSSATRQTSLYGSSPQYEPVRNARPVTSSTAQPRKDFFPASASPRNNFVEPSSAPHKAQPHFYGLPDLDLNFGAKKEQNAGKAAGSDRYCCSFDSFADAGDEISSKKARDALLVGSEGGLEVFRVLPNKLEVVGRLEGLRGSVIGAKILPHTDLYDDLQLLRPLVALIVHGPMLEEKGDLASKADRRKEKGMEEPRLFYQTTVEIYSLQTQEYVATLYKSLPVAVEQPTIGHLSSLPEPIGDLRITAQGKFVLLASGRSGELFIFTQVPSSVTPDGEFRCIGKFWTSLQSPLDNSSSQPPGSADTSQTNDESHEKVRTPLFSLSPRWLALVPPSTSSHVSIQGFPTLTEHNPNPAGVASAVAPPQPPVTCDIAGIESEDAWSRLTRQAARGVVKYSQKGIDLGWQGWRELTNPTTPSAQHGRTPSKEHEELFPPTNAPPDDPRRAQREPVVVSIIDLVALLEAEVLKPKYPPAPLATFPLREGCNFLSFSSSGLRLLTVSRKGDMSTIWDLSRCCHGGARLYDGKSDQPSPNGPYVSQTLRIPRNSPSVVVDCAWSRDDENLALLTTHGTIHLHEIPARSSGSRKRKRRNTNLAPTAPDKAQATVSVSHASSPPSSNSGFLGSIKSSWQQVSSQVTSFRTQNPVSSLGIPTSFAGFREVTASAGQASGRALAKGLSQGLNAAKGGASDYWHADDNKIRHKALQDAERSPGSLRWIKRQSDLLLAVVCAGTVHLHPVQRVERRKGDEMVSGLKRDKYGQKHFALPSIRTRGSASHTDVVQNGITPPQQTQGKKSAARLKDDAAKCALQGPHGFWSLCLRPASPGPVARGHATGGAALSGRQPQPSEVETNPPYCPFHISPRVDIFVFHNSDENTLAFSADDETFAAFHTYGHGSARGEASQWIFGDPLPANVVKLNSHEDLADFRGGGLGDGSEGDIDIDIDMDDLEEQVRSTLTIRTAATATPAAGVTGSAGPGQLGAREDEEEEIRITSWRGGTPQGKKEGVVGGEERDGGFEVLVDDDDSLDGG